MTLIFSVDTLAEFSYSNDT